VFYPARVQQLSFFSAEASSPSVADLAGVLCGHGQIVSFGRTAARLSVLVDEPWRARGLVIEFGRRAVNAEVARTDAGELLVRTAFRADLIGLAAAWHGGAEKEVPPGYRFGGGVLRMWALARGCRGAAGYLLGLDELAPGTHDALAEGITALGLGGTRLGPRGGGPAIRVSGRRRLATLAELIGEPPPGAELAWPEVVPARRAG
jgi:hypothetical protein